MARPTDKRWKGILIDWPTIADMDANDYELKPLNQQQVAILLALLEYQKWPTRWTGLEMDKSELETYIADIEQRLMRNEDSGMPEPIDTYEAIKMGIYDAFNDMAKQLVSGRVTNITVGSDGTVSDPTSGIPAEPVEDDPTTPIDEELSALGGSAIMVRKGVNQLLADLNTLYGVDATADTTLADALFIISSKYKVDIDALTAAMTEYWADRAAAKVQLTTIDTFNLDSALFCKGVSKQTINTVIIAITAVTIEARQNAVSIINSLTDEQLSDWYARGAGVPSTAYLTYSCTKNLTETFTLDFALAESFTFPFSSMLKANHRYLIEAVGSFVDTDVANVVQDFFWKIDTSTGVKTFIGFTLSVSGTTNATQAQVPYQPSHKYAWSFDKTGDDFGSFTKANDVFVLPNVSGIVTVTLTDLGEFTV